LDLLLIAPEIGLVCLGLIVLVLDLIFTPRGKAWTNEAGGNAGAWLGYVSVIGLIVPVALLVINIGRNDVAFSGMFVQDPLALFFKTAFLAAAALVLLASINYLPNIRVPAGEFYALLLWATAGLMLMVSSRELITIYVSLELATISLALLAGFHRGDGKSVESGLKYVLLSAIASATLLYGMAMFYGLTGTTYLEGIGKGLSSGTPAALFGVALLAAGFGFKIAAVPFHMWAPDVYEGAPTPITAFLSVGSKAAGFALILRVFTLALAPMNGTWPLMFALLAVFTMTIGNIIAIRQDNIKRLLAYSSITQAGYAIMALAVATVASSAALSFFLFAYTFTNVGAFLVVMACAHRLGSDEISAYAGLARRSPLLSIVLTLCLLSLAGIPPMVGFASKMYLFWTVFQSGWLWLVVVGLLNSAASIYYYLRVVRTMYLSEPAEDSLSITIGGTTRLAMLIAVAGVLVIGVLPWPLMSFAQYAAASLPIK
jgi:NADH-quinone oxidoreductase subunit N